MRATYARNYVAQSTSGIGSRGCINGSGGAGHGGNGGGGGGGGVKGSPLRELHNAVFDALTVKRPAKVWHAGNGSLIYDVVGKWVPAGIVGWMLGLGGRSGNVGFARGDFGSQGSGAFLGEDSATWEEVEMVA